jgi:biotin transport system substrate-specific component
MLSRQLNNVAVKVTQKEGEMLARALLFAALTGMGAIIRIPLSPVPVTMQVFFVLLSGLVLGPFWGATSQLLYLLMGLCGAPFFAAPPYAGPAVLFGPTGGYLWGFVLAAGIAGLLGNTLAARTRPGTAARLLVSMCACLAGIAVIYVSGTTWLGAWLSLHGTSASAAYELGVKPFILVDMAKATAAASLVVLVPRRWSTPVW